MSPSGHYVTMSKAVLATGRKIVFQICEWGVDFPSAWAPPLGNSWRITNDIIPFYRTIPRILNQAVPQTDFAGPEHWLDLDMLEVGNNVFTTPEEQTHFSLWAIIKSPLVIGAALKDSYTSISAASLAILKNVDVISYNQDSLGVAASFRRRWTSDREIWAGPLSGNRIVVAVINLEDVARTLTLDLPDVGVQKAGMLKDIWNGVTANDVLTSYTAHVEAHGTILLELSETTAAGEYEAEDCESGANEYTVPSHHLNAANHYSQTTTCSKIYGETTSSNYTCSITFDQASGGSTELSINNKAYTLPANAKSLKVPLALDASDINTVSISSPISPTSFSITAPPQSFYPSTSFTVDGTATRITCYTGLCKPVGSKIGYISPTGSASLKLSSPTTSISGPKFVEMYFCNDDIALATSWTTGTNTRNMTISVNGVVSRIEVPLSGRSSELFSPGLGWQDTGLFGVLIDGWVSGSNEVVVGNVYGDEGLVSYGADFVGLGVYW